MDTMNAAYSMITSSNRKIRKPLMEKRRRARINQSLNELQQLISETDSNSKNMKMEKADILEMTVQYLKQIKDKDSTNEYDENNSENQMIERYRLGFEKCIQETKNLVSVIPGVDNQIQSKINHHLKMCLENMQNQATHNLDLKRKTQSENKLMQLNDEITQNKTNSSLMKASKSFHAFPSKLLNGDIILIITPNSSESKINSNKSDVWRPWW